jgi:hypothetical protein
METFIKAVQDTTIPNILVWAGLFVLITAFVTKIGGIIEVSPEQKRWAIPVGLFLLALGLALNLTSPSTISTPSPAPAPSTGDLSKSSTASLLAEIPGTYENHQHDGTNNKNGYHYVTISQVSDTKLEWKNRAGKSWSLFTTPDKDILRVGEDCPYFQDGHKEVTVVWEGSRVSGLRGPGDELYEKS